MQYADWLGRIILQGDFGRSWVAKVPASDLIGVSLWPTIKLALAAQLIATALAIPLGLLSAVKRYSLIDNVTTFIVLVGQAMPLVTVTGVQFGALLGGAVVTETVFA